MALLVACNTEPSGNEFGVASVKISPETAVVPRGGTLQLKAEAQDTSGSAIQSVEFTWSSSDPSIISVSRTGLVTAEGDGSAIITATASGVSGASQLSVFSVAISSIEVGLGKCGLTSSSKAFCLGNQGAPEIILPQLSFSQLTTVGGHACALTPAGTAYCWGANNVGQLGAGLTPSSQCHPVEGVQICPPVQVSGNLIFVQLSAGAAHTCGIVTDGAAYCWGYNNWAQLGAAGGNSCEGQPCSPVPVPVNGGLTFRELSAGLSHTCGVTSDGKAYCWGINLLGQLGIGELGGRADEPTAVAGGLVFASVHAGFEHTCGVVVGGAAFCWGSNDYGALGTGGPDNREHTPAPVSGGLTFNSVSAGARVSCGVTPSGAGYCWGQGLVGSLGTGEVSDSRTPVQVSGGLSFTSITLGVGMVACGMAAPQTAYCWGGGQSFVPKRVVGQP